MKIDRAEVEHVARLARLKIDDADVEKLTDQLNNILSYMEKLNELDTSAIEPMAHALPLSNAFREDKVRPSFEPDDTLANAPEKDRTFFLVPRVI